MRSQLQAMALMRLMVVPIMGEWASIVEPIMAVQLTGMVVQGTPMARVADRQPGTMARAALQVGAGAPLRGIMDREAPAVSEAARPRGVAAPGARPDGEAARSLGAAVVFTVADSGDEAASQPRDVSGSRNDCLLPDRPRLAQKSWFPGKAARPSFSLAGATRRRPGVLIRRIGTSLRKGSGAVGQWSYS
jgi:hypothetical protein